MLKENEFEHNMRKINQEYEICLQMQANFFEKNKVINNNSFKENSHLILHEKEEKIIKENKFSQEKGKENLKIKNENILKIEREYRDKMIKKENETKDIMDNIIEKENEFKKIKNFIQVQED